LKNRLTNLCQTQLHGDAAAAAQKAGVKEVTVSISHSDSQAVAIALSKF
jgi:fatty acid synthase subunit alpha